MPKKTEKIEILHPSSPEWRRRQEELLQKRLRFIEEAMRSGNVSALIRPHFHRLEIKDFIEQGEFEKADKELTELEKEIKEKS